MSSTTNASFAHHSWQTPRNARTLRAYMALHNQEIAERLRELRGSRPQVLVASGIGASPRALQNWEAGIARPSWRNVERLAEYYEVPEEYILTGGRRSLARTGSETEHPTPKVETSTVEARLERVEDTLQEVRQSLEELHGQREGFLQLLADQQNVLEQIADQLGDDALRNRADKAVAASIEQARAGLAASAARASQHATQGPAATAGTTASRRKSKA